ncbi:MAG: exodeoxyribonuclease III [Selenomonadaceae bacterium]|nr:exodeoxyribonuclease III [Selenomonadaceae bacterium]
MKIISWNLNGLQSCVVNKSFLPIKDQKPDIFCCQEIRTKEEMTMIEGYNHIWNHANRDKYSGTAVLTLSEPNEIIFGFGDNEDVEGRLITLEYDEFYLVNTYVPNSQMNLKRKAYRLEWDYAFREYIENLILDKSVIICGDFNVTRSELDVFAENQRAFWQEQGLISDERANLEELLNLGLIDVFRELNPNERSYTWWSNRLNRRSLNRGWRLDYFLVSDDLRDKIIGMKHLTDIEGSDHCPLMLELEL